MKIKQGSVKVNDLINPTLDSAPYFSYLIDSMGETERQKGYEITVREHFSGDVIWSSGKVITEKRYGIYMDDSLLEPRKRYDVTVKVTGDDGEKSSAETFFCTGKRGEKWLGNWITGGFCLKRDEALEAPYLRRDFDVCGKVRRATLYICGLGYFVCTLNGKRVNKDFLSTPFTDYDKHLMYRSFDVTDVLSDKNAIGVVLGNGFYNCFTIDPWQSRFASWRDVPKMICELHIEYENGDEQTVCSDTGWQSSKGPITFNGIRHGEQYDANLEMPGWDMPGYKGETFGKVRVVRPAGGELMSYELEPIVVRREYPAVKMTKQGEKTLFDIGQNQAGVCRLTLRGKKGDKITIRYCDIINDKGELDQSPLSCFIKNYTFQTEIYTKKSDEPEAWHSEFTYHGYQYVEISGGDEERQLSDVVALALCNGIEDRGYFVTSDETVNQIQHMCVAATTSCCMNTLSSDAVREKTSWTGDAGFTSEQIVINFGAEAFMRRWLYDLRDSQTPAGAVPCVIPSAGWGYTSLNGPDWASPIVDAPKYLYLASGNINYIKDNYNMLTRHCALMEKMATDNIVDYGLGDWCAPFEGPALSVNMESFKCPVTVTDTAYYHTAVRTLAYWAKLLGRDDDEKYYAVLADNIKAAFREKFFDKKTFTVKGNCQTSTAVMIYHGLCEADEVQPLTEKLLQQIKERDGHLDFGVLGNKAVMNVLGTTGNAKTGLMMLCNPTYPSVKHWIDMGANTLWECWNGLGSRNHHMFSDMSAFLYKYVGGISADMEKPAYEHIIFRPALDVGIKNISCGVNTPYGTARTEISENESGAKLTVTVPSGSSGTLYVPVGYSRGAEKFSDCGNGLVKTELLCGVHSFVLEK
mgnify:FL=1